MRVLLAALVIVLTATFAARAHGEGERLTPEDRRAFAWFDGLGFSSTAGRPYVAVSAGRPPTEFGNPRPAEKAEGFLLAEDDSAYDVLTADLFVRRFSRVPTKEIFAATIERLDLAARAAARLAEVQRPFQGPSRDAPLGERAELLAFARHCAEHGLDGPAHDLVAEARKLPDLRDGQVDARPVEEVAADEMATPMIWRHTLDFGDASIPRAKLLDRFRRFAASFPRSEHAPKAADTAALLERMLREDEEHAKTAKPWDAMSKDERIAELIWRLRDAPGGQFMQPGSPGFFHEDAEERPTALAQLVAYGPDAVPQLIPALEDMRFTRCVGYWRDFTYSHFVQRVGDAALQALQVIAKRVFWEGKYTAAAMAKDGEAAAVRARVEAWWADYRSKGEKDVLVATVAEGGTNSARALVELVKTHPEAAAAAALTGLRNATGGARFNLLGASWKIDDPALTAHLVELAVKDPDLECRALAASKAIELRRLEVVPSLIELWRLVRTTQTPGMRTRTTIIHALVRSGAPEAIAALGEKLAELDPAVAGELAQHVGLQLRFLSKIDGYPVASARAAEDLVASLLDDTRETGMTSSTPGGSVRIRVCDSAAAQLGVAWDRPFRRDAELDARNRQIAELQALRRQRRAAEK